MALHVAATSTADALCARFRQRFDASPRLFRAPGRVNLIGEHTDYNDGFVLPAAIGLSCWVAAAARSDRKIIIHSEQFNETSEADFADAPSLRTGRWSDYPLGVAAMLHRAGIRVPGANMLIHSDVPMGGGLGSSAALEAATAGALTALAGQHLALAQLAQLCQQAEHQYVGVRCGIMDQFVALHGAAGHALLLDCRSLQFTPVPVPGALRLATCNTMVKHEHAAGEYNQRRADCEEAVRLLAVRLPGICALRDVSPAQLDEHRRALPERSYRRARHIVTENARTEDAAAALREGDLTRLGRRMAESHASLRDDYEVSCKELDLMAAIAASLPGVVGARMTGGGFGGCVVSLLHARHAEEFHARVADEYARQTGRLPQVFIFEAAAAAGEVAVR